MSLRFRYKLFSAGHPIFPLGGRSVRPRPILGVTVIGPTDSRLRDAVLDSAADDTVFAESLAAQIGVDLRNAPVGYASGIGLVRAPVRYAELTLRITDGHEYREWPARVGFTPAALKRTLLGFAGFLQFFTAMFQGDREEFQLTVNSLYPGT